MHCIFFRTKNKDIELKRKKACNLRSVKRNRETCHDISMIIIGQRSLVNRVTYFPSNVCVPIFRNWNYNVTHAKKIKFVKWKYGIKFL